MANLILYLVTVMIWGTTWYVIKLQLGVVPESWSVAWRFFIASAALAVWLGFRGRLNNLPRGRDLAFVCGQGALLFSLNYWLFYQASNYLTTGLVAILFSLITLMNIVNQRVFFGVRANPRLLLASSIGISGLVLVFYPEFSGVQYNTKLAYSVALGIVATWFASLGNMISLRNSRAGLPVMRTNMVGMLAGAICISVIALANGDPVVLELTPRYLGALAYLAIVGSVVAFGCYLTLIHRIGADRGAYAGVAFPVVALMVSTLFENYQWTYTAAAGVGLIILGNVLVLSNAGKD